MKNLTNLLENFKNYEVKLNKSTKTIEGYLKEARYFMNDYNINSVEDLKIMESKEFWSQWLEDMTSKYQAGTVNKKKTALSVFSKFLIFEEIIEVNKVQQIESLKNDNKKIEVYTDEEIEKIFNYMENKIKANKFQRKIDKEVYFMNMVAIKLLYKNALRVCEVVSIEMKDFNLDEGNKFYIHGKGGHGKVTRFNSFSKDMIESINECLEIRNKIKIKEGNEQYFLISPISKSKLTEDSIRKFLRNILKELEIESSSVCHNLRHYRATELISKGQNVKNVSLFLGHANVKTTEHYYIHQNEEVMEELSEI